MPKQNKDMSHVKIKSKLNVLGYVVFWLLPKVVSVWLCVKIEERFRGIIFGQLMYYFCIINLIKYSFVGFFESLFMKLL